MQLPPSVRAAFARHGRRGGRLRAQHLSPERRRTIARRAALARWIRARFGASRFDETGLPGGAMVDRGLDDLVAGQETADSLTLALAAPRLRREAVPLPSIPYADAALRLYRLLEAREGRLAHARYLARLEEIASFADACREIRLRERGRA